MTARRKPTLDTVLTFITVLALTFMFGALLSTLWLTHNWGTFLKLLLSAVALWVVIAIAAALILGDTKQQHRLPAIEMVAVAWDEGYQAGTHDAPRRWMGPNLPPQPNPYRALPNPYRKPDPSDAEQESVAQ